MHSLEDAFYSLINRQHAFAPASREELVMYYAPRLKAIGLEDLQLSLPKKVVHVAGKNRFSLQGSSLLTIVL